MRVAGYQTRFDRPAERAELGVERGRLRPRERVRRGADGDRAAPAECVVGVGAEAGHPLGAVRVELEEVRGRVRVGRRARAVDEGRVRVHPGVLLERQLPWRVGRSDQDVDPDLLDQSSRLGERLRSRAAPVGGVAAEVEADRAAADRDAAHPVGRFDTEPAAALDERELRARQAVVVRGRRMRPGSRRRRRS